MLVELLADGPDLDHPGARLDALASGLAQQTENAPFFNSRALENSSF
jgi:hypothetical protein